MGCGSDVNWAPNLSGSPPPFLCVFRVVGELFYLSLLGEVIGEFIVAYDGFGVSSFGWFGFCFCVSYVDYGCYFVVSRNW